MSRLRPSLALVIALTVLLPQRPCAGQADSANAQVMAVASAEQLGPRELRISVTYFNCGGEFDIDYVAFLHFDRTAHGARLYFMPEPGPRPLVGGTRSSTWGPNDAVTVTFATVTIPEGLKRDIFVKAGMYDAKGTGRRLPLIAADDDQRVLVGRLAPGKEGWKFVRTPPSRRTRKTERIGVRPRGLVKPMPTSPAVRFGEIDLNRWRIECTGGASASAERTREELCWSEASLEVAYSGEGRSSAFVLRPPQPLPVPGEADVAHLWLLGRACAWSKTRTPEQPLLSHYLEFRDGRGDVRALRFRRRIGYPYWYVARRRLPSDWPRPLAFRGASFSGCTNRKPRSLILDALVFAREKPADRLTTDARLDDVPFPADPNGLLPSQSAAPFDNRIDETADGCALWCEGVDGRLCYIYRPRTGTLDDIEAAWCGPAREGKPFQFRFAAGGGPVIEIGGKSYSPSSTSVRRTRLLFDVGLTAVRTRWRCEAPEGATEYALNLSVKGKSLLVEIEAADESLAAFLPGSIEGVRGARFVDFPYWTWTAWDWGRDGGAAVVGDLFVSGYVDWYRSHASSITFGPPKISHRPEALTGRQVHFCPGVEYRTCSDGHRSPLRERFVFTVSPNVHETLPNIPHSPTPNREKLVPYVHSTGGRASDLEGQLDEWRRLAAYGVSKVYIRHFDGMWADVPQGPQEWTLTEHAAPLVGDVAMKRYLDELSRMGFLPVLYTNYTDLQPVAAEFDWDKVCMLPDGDISDRCWPGSYPLKPLRAVELEAQFAPRIAKRFGTRGSFCDVHTAASPWRKVDYDARLPGAGQFGTTYRSYAKLLMNERATYGAVYSEGSIHWLYAGLHDGSDAQLRGPRPHREPFLVDFDLLKIHPKQMDAGMSWISRYVMRPEDAEELGGREAAQDRFVAATIAFGHQGTFTGYRFRDYRTDIKTYYMIQPLQTLYAMRRAVKIRYRDPGTGRLVATSDAIRSDAYRESQVYVRYDSGLEVRVNGSLRSDWDVSVDGRAYRVPPSGFVCNGPGPAIVYSAMTKEGRVDFRATPGVRFIDARGQRQRVEEFETDGAAIVCKLNGTTWGVWPLGRLSVLGIDCKALGLRASLTVSSYDEEGALIKRSDAALDNGRLVLPLGDEGFRYDVEATQ